MIKFDFNTYTNNFISENQIKEYEPIITDIKAYFETSNMMGWYNLDNLFNKELIEDINKTATYIKNNCDAFLVIGIGGSYLGASAAIEALNPYFYNDRVNPQIYFVGNNLSSDYYHDLIDIIKDKDIIINVVSKSGSTLETLVSYQIMMDLMKQKYSNEEISKRIIITTDSKNSILRDTINENNYKSFIFPSNIGGRYSVLTAAGLLPMAVANINIESLYLGAKEANANLDNQIKYAVIRKIMNDQGKKVEAYVAYEPKLYGFTEWLKQLYGESLGKEEKGILPISFINSRDLHSLGQFVQEGTKILYETVINVLDSKNDINIPLFNKTLNELNNIASLSTSKAHMNGKVLNNVITIDKIDEKNIGYLFQFFMVSCVISGYLDNVNPFDQNGVEEYKKIMKELLK